MSNIDDRIVRMQFDDTGFEAGAAKAIDTLNKLGTALNFEGAGDGLKTLQNSINSFSMDPLGNAIGGVQKGFSILDKISFGFFSNIGRSMSNFVMSIPRNITKALTDPIKEGFEEYQLQMRSLQTISANDTSSSMEVIEQNLNELNEYADRTIYNFSQMTQNIGRFTAAGIDVTSATKAIKGFSNAAALAGAGTEETSRGMYQLSQAMSAGAVKLQDWKSIENASIDTERFRDVIVMTAKHAGVAVDDLIKENGSFRASLAEGWLSANIMQEALENMTMTTHDAVDVEKRHSEILAELTQRGYTEEQAEQLIEVANAAYDSATEIRTFDQLMQTMKESLGSGWAQTWQIIVGNFDEATQLFTWLGQRFGSVIDAMSDARNAFFNEWKDAGGRKAMIDSMADLFEALVRIITPIKDAFTEVFGITGTEFANITSSISGFISSLVLSEEAMGLVNLGFTDFFQTIHAIIGIFGNLLRVVGLFVQKAFEGANSQTFFYYLMKLVEELAFTFTDLQIKADEFVASLAKNGAFNGVKIIFRNLAVILANVMRIIIALIPIISSVISSFWELTAPIRNFALMLANAFGSWLISKIRELKDSIKNIARWLESWGGYLSIIFRNVGSIISEVYDIVSGFFIAIWDSINGNSIVEKLKTWFEDIRTFVRNLFQDDIDEDTDMTPFISKIFDAVAGFLDLIRSFGGDDRVQFFKDWFKSISDTVGGPFSAAFSIASWIIDHLVGFITGPLASGLQGLKDWFGQLEIANPFTAIWDTLKQIDLSKIFNGFSLPKTLTDKLDDLKKKFGLVSDKANDATNSVSDFIAQASKKVYTTGKNKLTGAIEAINGAFDELVKYFSKFKDSGKSFSQIIEQVLKDAFDTFKSWVNTIANNSSGFVGAISKAFSFALEELTKLPQKISEFFGNAKKTAEDGVKQVGDTASDLKNKGEEIGKSIIDGLPTPEEVGFSIGNFFGSIGTSITEGIAGLITGGQNGGGSIGANLAKIFDFSEFEIKLPDFKGFFSQIAQDVSDTLDLFPSEKVEELIGEKGVITTAATKIGKIWLLWNGNKWLGSLANFNNGLGKEGKGIGEFFEKMPDAVENGMKGLGKAFTDGAGQAFGTGTKNIADGMKEFGKAFTPFKQSKAKSFKQIAEGILVLAAALFVVAQIPADDLERAGEAILKLGICAGALIFFASWLSGMAKLDLNGVGMAMAGLGIGMLAMAGAIFLFTKMSADPNMVLGMNNFKMVLEMLTGAMAVILLLSHGADLTGVAATILSLAFVMGGLIAAIAVLGIMPENWYNAGIERLETLMMFVSLCTSVIGALAGGASGKALLGASAAILALTAAVTLLIIPVGILGVLPSGIVDQGMTNVEWLMLFSTLCIAVLSLIGTNGPGILAGTVAMVALAAAVTAMVIPVTILGVIPFNTISQGIVAVGVLGIIMVGIIALLSMAAINIGAVIAGAAAMVVINLAVLGMAAIVAALSFVNEIGSLKAGIAAFYEIIIGIAAIALIGSIGAGGLFALAGALAVLGISFVALAAGITALQTMPDWGALGTAVHNLGMKFVELGDNIMAGLLEGIESVAPGVGESILTIAAGIVNSFCDFLGIQSPSTVMEENGENTVQGLIDGIQNKLGEVLGTGEETGESAVEGFNAADMGGKFGTIAHDAIDQFLQGVDAQDLGGKLGGKADEGIQGFLNGIDTEALSQKGADIVAGLISGIGENLQTKMETAASDVFHSFTDPVLQFFGIQSPSTYMRDTVGANIIAGLADGLGQNEPVATKATEIRDAISNGLGDFAEWLSQKAAGGMEAFNAAFGAGAQTASTTGAQITTEVDNGLSLLPSNMKTKSSTAMTNFIGGITSKISSAKAQVVSLRTQSVNALSTMAGDFRSKASSAVSALVGALNSGISSARAAASGLCQAAKNGLTNLWGAFHSVGLDAVNGFIGGLTSKIGQIASAAASMVSTAINTARRTANSHSPSKVFIAIGGDIGDGFVIGIEKSIPAVMHASEDMASAVPDAFSDSLKAMSFDIDDLIDTDFNPVITPVINPTEFNSDLSMLSSAMNGSMANMSIGNLNYTGELSAKISDANAINKQALETIAKNGIDYNRLGVSVANALISSGVYVKMDGGQMVGYLAGEIRDARRQYVR